MRSNRTLLKGHTANSSSPTTPPPPSAPNAPGGPTASTAGPTTSTPSAATSCLPSMTPPAPRAVRWPQPPPIHQRPLPAKVMSMSPLVNPHSMTTQTKAWLPDASRQALIVGHLIVDSLSLRCPPLSTPPSSTRLGVMPRKKNMML
jgi:hypothetical protein